MEQVGIAQILGLRSNAGYFEHIKTNLTENNKVAIGSVSANLLTNNLLKPEEETIEMTVKIIDVTCQWNTDYLEDVFSMP